MPSRALSYSLHSSTQHSLGTYCESGSGLGVGSTGVNQVQPPPGTVLYLPAARDLLRHWSSGSPGALPVPLTLPVTCPRASFSSVYPTPVQLSEAHSPGHLAVLFFWGPVMPQDRKEFCEPSTNNTSPRPLHQKPGQEGGCGRCSPIRGWHMGCSSKQLAAGHYIGEETESL